MELLCKLKIFFREIETSNDLVRTSQVRYLNLVSYQPCVQYDAHKFFLQLLMNICPNINDDCIFKFDKLESTPCNNCGHTANANGICIVSSLHFEDSISVQTISGICH